MKVFIAVGVTFLMCGFVVSEYGVRHGREGLQLVGEAMEQVGVLTAASVGLVVLWGWAL